MLQSQSYSNPSPPINSTTNLNEAKKNSRDMHHQTIKSCPVQETLWKLGHKQLQTQYHLPRWETYEEESSAPPLGSQYIASRD